MSDRKGKQAASARLPSLKAKMPPQSIIKTRSALAHENETALRQSQDAHSSKKQRTSTKRSRTEGIDVEAESIVNESSPKKVKVLPSVAKSAASIISNPATMHARFPVVQKRESHTPFLSDQSFGDEQQSRAAKSHDLQKQKQVEPYNDESTGNKHTFGHPPLPLPGLEGHGSYVWVPHDATVEEEDRPTNLPNDVTEDRMTGSDDDEYIDPLAADYTDFPEDNDFDDNHISVNEEEEEIVKQSSGIASPSSDTVYLEDIDPRASHSQSSACEIWNLFNSEDDFKQLMDPMLMSAYPSLPALRSHNLTTWRSSNEVSGLIMWSSWKNQLRKPNMSYLSKFVTFQCFDNFINPARADPASFTTFTDGYLSTMKSRQNGKICLCLSPVYIVQSRLLEPHPRSQSTTSFGNQMLLKSIDCIFHSYEWERSSSFWCTVFKVETMQAQLIGAAISMETKPSKMVDVESSVPGLFSISASPSKKARSVGTSKVKIQLKHTDSIPVFDGRNKQFNLNRSLERLEQLLPPFNGEIPSGSLALVAYTANGYYRNPKSVASRQGTSESIMNLALNINWAVVLGVPK